LNSYISSHSLMLDGLGVWFSLRVREGFPFLLYCFTQGLRDPWLFETGFIAFFVLWRTHSPNKLQLFF